MDASTVMIIILAVIIVLSVLGIITQHFSDKFSISRQQSSAQAYATRQSANVYLLKALAPLGPHDVTTDENAVMTVQPSKPAPQAATVAQGPSIGVRYVIDDSHPDSIQRRDLLRIVEHTMRYYGNDGTIIRAEPAVLRDKGI